jgi:hypothetical protein
MKNASKGSVSPVVTMAASFPCPDGAVRCGLQWETPAALKAGEGVATEEAPAGLSSLSGAFLRAASLGNRGLRAG